MSAAELQAAVLAVADKLGDVNLNAYARCVLQKVLSDLAFELRKRAEVVA